MLETVDWEAVGDTGARLSLWPWCAGQRGFARRYKSGNSCRVCRRVDRGPTLAECYQPARLETRTKESNMYASLRVVNLSAQVT